MDYTTIGPALIELGISGAILFVGWRVVSGLKDTVETLTGNHLNHIHKSLEDTRHDIRMGFDRIANSLDRNLAFFVNVKSSSEVPPNIDPIIPRDETQRPNHKYIPKV